MSIKTIMARGILVGLVLFLMIIFTILGGWLLPAILLMAAAVIWAVENEG